ncbi:MAG: hypothetical protein ACLUTU_09405 [Blautia faecis]
MTKEETFGQRGTAENQGEPKEQEADTSSALDKSSASDRAKKQPAGKTEHKQPQRAEKKTKI